MGKHAAIAPITPRLVDADIAAAYTGRGRTKFVEDVEKGRLPAHSDQNGNVKLWDIRLLDAHLDRLSGLGETMSPWDR